MDVQFCVNVQLCLNKSMQYLIKQKSHPMLSYNHKILAEVARSSEKKDYLMLMCIIFLYLVSVL